MRKPEETRGTIRQVVDVESGRLHGFRLSSIFVPHIDHLKVSYQPGRPLEAKAYIGLMLRWGVAWDALSSVGGMWASPLGR